MENPRLESAQDSIDENSRDEEFLLEQIKRMVKDSLAYIPGTLIPAIMSLVVVMVLTRLFPPQDFGIYSIAIATVTLANLFLTTWIDHAILRYRAQYLEESRLKEFNRLYLLLVILLTLISITTLFAFLPLFFGPLREYLGFYLPCACFVISTLWFETTSTFLMADLRSHQYSIFMATNAILSVVIALILILIVKRDIAFAIWGMVCSQLVLIMPLLITTGIIARANRYEKDAALKLNFFSFLKKMGIYGIPLIGWFIGSYLLSISDRYFLQIFKGSYEVGIYSPNYNLVMKSLNIVTYPLLFAAHALIMKAHAESPADKNKIKNLITEFSRYYLLVAIPIFVYVTIFSYEIASVFLGKDYVEGHTIIPIILFGYLVWNLSFYGHKGLEITEKTNRMMGYMGICVAVNVTLNFIFVPLMGYVGASITSLIGLLIYPILVYYGTRKELSWQIPWKNVVRIFFSASLMGVVCLLAKLFLPLRSSVVMLGVTIILGSLVFMLSILMVKEIRPFEIGYIRVIAEKPIFRRRGKRK
jgi:O-antigen/teichoic acid export membrane protein